MKEKFTKGMARNILWGIFILFPRSYWSYCGYYQQTSKTDNREAITETVAQGKKVWEENNCVECHTLLGEGAYFTPELVNVYMRFGKSTETIKAFIKSHPVNCIPRRSSMLHKH